MNKKNYMNSLHFNNNEMKTNMSNVFVCHDLCNGLCVVVDKDLKYYYANEKGEIVLGPYMEAKDFLGENTLVRLFEDGNWRLINKSGKIIRGPFDYAYMYNDGCIQTHDKHKAILYLTNNGELNYDILRKVLFDNYKQINFISTAYFKDKKNYNLIKKYIVNGLNNKQYLTDNKKKYDEILKKCILCMDERLKNDNFKQNYMFDEPQKEIKRDKGFCNTDHYRDYD